MKIKIAVYHFHRFLQQAASSRAEIRMGGAWSEIRDRSFDPEREGSIGGGHHDFLSDLSLLTPARKCDRLDLLTYRTGARKAGQRVPNRPGSSGNSAERARQMLLCGNGVKNLLQIKDLAFFRP